MATKQKDKATSKPRQRSRKVVAPQRENLDQVQSPKLDPEIEEPIVPEVAAIDAAAIDQTVAVNEAAAVEFVPSEISVAADHSSTIELKTTEVAPAISPPMESATTPMEPAATTEHVSIGIQTIANAYKTYANKSLEQTGSFVEKLMSARSFDKAAEAQIEFARQACASFIAESQNICQLYSRLTGQMLRSWQGSMIGTRAT